MTAVDPGTRPTPPTVDDSPAEPPLTPICPYLAAADGTWRSTTVAREHRCGAVSPPAILAADKQRRLCLTADHLRCATYEAARIARPIGQDRATTLPRPMARTTPVVLDHGRINVAMPALRGERLTGQVILIVLLALAFAAIVLARMTGGATPAGLELGSPTPRVSAHASAGPSKTPATTRPSGSVDPSSGAPSGRTGASDAPASAGATAGSASTTYKVKAGDTLVGIAAKYGTTPKAIAKLNGLANLSSLKIGQVLKIP